MDDRQLGALIRAARQRRKLRQQDVAELVGIGRSTISEIENGNLGVMSLNTIRLLASALQVRIELKGWWRGGDGGRLLSRRHSLLANRFAAFIGRFSGWFYQGEVSFSIWGEHGILDGLGWHAETRHLFVAQFKTEFVDMNEMLGTADRHARVALALARERGWQPERVSLWVIVSDSRTNRRQAAQHRALLATRLRLDGRSLPAFLANPAEATTGLAFMPSVNGGDTRQDDLAPREAVRPKRQV